MKIEAHLTELFARERIPTEFRAWKLLAADPPPQPATYLALPWSVVINHNLFDQLPTLSLQNGVTVCQHISFRNILPSFRKMGGTTLFSPHAEETLAEGVQIQPFPHFPVNARTFGIKKDLWYSFVGFGSHPVRRTLFRLPQRKDTVIQRRRQWHFYLEGEAYRKGVAEYQELLSRSRFSLCPRGTGPGTLRFWESLGAGAIPVLFADTLRLPEYDWANCILRIPENQARQVEQMLRTIPPEREEVLRQNCLAAFHQFSGEQLVSPVRSFVLSH